MAKSAFLGGWGKVATTSGPGDEITPKWVVSPFVTTWLRFYYRFFRKRLSRLKTVQRHQLFATLGCREAGGRVML